jgi:hypothetical protein
MPDKDLESDYCSQDEDKKFYLSVVFCLIRIWKSDYGQAG